MGYWYYILKEKRKEKEIDGSHQGTYNQQFSTEIHFIYYVIKERGTSNGSQTAN